MIATAAHRFLGYLLRSTGGSYWRNLCIHLDSLATLSKKEVGETDCSDSGLRGSSNDSIGFGFRDMSSDRPLEPDDELLDAGDTGDTGDQDSLCIGRMMYDTEWFTVQVDPLGYVSAGRS